MDRAAYILSRFTMGGKVGQRHDIAGSPLDWALEEVDKTFDLTIIQDLPDTRSMATIMREMRIARQNAARSGRKSEVSKSFLQRLRKAFAKQAQAHFRQAVENKTSIHDRLALFWANHFTVSGSNNIVRPFVPAYQREAIYPNLNGYFGQMLWAAETHPAMLLYLDNHISVGPNSRAGKRRGKDLNENLAREILELHTLGVDAGYSQGDVTSFAKILTGWTIGGRLDKSKVGQSVFHGAMHEPGNHQLLGKTYRGAGEEQLKTALGDLVSHPSTAEFIARKLAIHFIADNPPESAVEALTKTFHETNGHLPSLHKAVLKQAMAHAQPFVKARTPHEYLTASLRALSPNSFGENAYKIMPRILVEMGQRPFSPPGPDGWPDDAASWISPQGIMRRVNIANAIATRMRDQDARSLMQDIYGDLLSDDTAQHIRRAESATQGLAIALASPEMLFR